MTTHKSLTNLFKNIADAIRSKTGSTGTIVADDFPSAIKSISSGADAESIIDATVKSSCYAAGHVYEHASGNSFIVIVHKGHPESFDVYINSIQKNSSSENANVVSNYYKSIPNISGVHTVSRTSFNALAGNSRNNWLMSESSSTNSVDVSVTATHGLDHSVTTISLGAITYPDDSCVGAWAIANGDIGSNYIKFKLGDYNIYEVPVGCTWGTWVLDYQGMTMGYIYEVSNGGYIYSIDASGKGGYYYITYNGNKVKSTDEIISGVDYTIITQSTLV